MGRGETDGTGNTLMIGHDIWDPEIPGSGRFAKGAGQLQLHGEPSQSRQVAQRPAVRQEYLGQSARFQEPASDRSAVRALRRFSAVHHRHDSARPLPRPGHHRQRRSRCGSIRIQTQPQRVIRRWTANLPVAAWRNRVRASIFFKIVASPRRSSSYAAVGVFFSPTKPRKNEPDWYNPFTCVKHLLALANRELSCRG